MTKIEVKVTFTMPNGKKVSAKQKNVECIDDPVQAAAANLAYGLVEKSWSVYGEEDGR